MQSTVPSASTGGHTCFKRFFSIVAKLFSNFAGSGHTVFGSIKTNLNNDVDCPASHKLKWRTNVIANHVPKTVPQGRLKNLARVASAGRETAWAWYVHDGEGRDPPRCLVPS